MEQRLKRLRQSLNRLAASRMLAEPGAYFKEKRLLLDYQSQRLVHGAAKTLSNDRERLARAAAALDAMSPLKVLGRGYAIARTEDGQVLTQIRQVRPGDGLRLRLTDGQLDCRVEQVTRLRAKRSAARKEQSNGDKEEA